MFKELFINQINQSENLRVTEVTTHKVVVENIEDDFEMIYEFDDNGNLVNTY